MVQYAGLKDYLLKAISLHKDRSKLVYVERTVTKKGKTFQQHFWIKPNEVQDSDVVLSGKENLPRGHKQRPDKVLAHNSSQKVDDSIKRQTHAFFNKFDNVEDCLGHLKGHGLYWKPPGDDLKPHVRAALNIMRAKMALNAAIHNGYTPPEPNSTNSLNPPDKESENAKQQPEQSDKQTNENTQSTSQSPNQNNTTSHKPTNEEGKQAVNAFQSNFESHEAFLDALKSLGISWKHNDHMGINLMRAKMAAKQAIIDGRNLEEEFANTQQQQQFQSQSSQQFTEKPKEKQIEKTKQFSGNTRPTAEHKKVVNDFQYTFPTRDEFYSALNKIGIQWNESQHDGINLMRAKMAASKAVANGLNLSEEFNKLNSQQEEKQPDQKPIEQPEKTDESDTKKVIQEYVDKHIDDEDWVNNLIVEYTEMLSDPRIDTNLRDVIVDYLMKNESKTLSQIKEEKKQSEEKQLEQKPAEQPEKTEEKQTETNTEFQSEKPQSAKPDVTSETQPSTIQPDQKQSSSEKQKSQKKSTKNQSNKNSVRQSPTKQSETVEEKLPRHYDSVLVQQLGKSHYDSLRDLLDKVPDSYDNLKTIWDKSEKDFKVIIDKTPGAYSYFNPSDKSMSINVTDYNTLGDNSLIYSSVFHEGMHSIDKNNSINPNFYYSVEYNDGEFIEALREDAKNLLKSYGLEENFRDAIKKEVEKRKNSDPSWFEDQVENIKWVDPDFDGDPIEYITDDMIMSDPRIQKLNQDMFGFDEDPQVDFTVIDILVGATNGDLLLPSNGGNHGKRYWVAVNNLETNDRGYIIQKQWTGLAIESFAEMTEVVLSGNTKGLDNLQTYFPTASKVYKEMLNKLAYRYGWKGKTSKGNSTEPKQIDKTPVPADISTNSNEDKQQKSTEPKQTDKTPSTITIKKKATKKKDEQQPSAKRNYQSKLCKTMGKQYYDSLRNTMDSVPDEFTPVKNLWANQENNLEIVSKYSNLTFYNPDDKTINIPDLAAVEKGTDTINPWVHVFHEGGHAIDHMSADDSLPIKSNFFSAQYKNGALVKSLKADVNNLCKSHNININDLESQREDLKKLALQKLEDEDTDWFAKNVTKDDKAVNSSLVMTQLFLGNEAAAEEAAEILMQSSLKEELENLKKTSTEAYLIVSDIISGTTNGEIMILSDDIANHTKDYWNHHNANNFEGIAAESFAEFTEAIMSNDTTCVTTLKKYFPDTFKTYIEMCEHLSK